MRCVAGICLIFCGLLCVGRADPASQRPDLAIWIIDRSGSMAGAGGDLVKSVEGFLGQTASALPDQTEVWIVFFSHQRGPERRWRGLQGGAREEIRRYLAAEFQPGGGTRLYDTVAEVLTEAAGEVSTHQRLSVAIFSDGADQSSQRKNWADVERIAPQLQPGSQAGWLRFYALGQSPPSNLPEFFRVVRAETGEQLLARGGPARPGGPRILQPPRSQWVRAGSSVAFQVEAASSLPLRYQWLRDGQVVRGETGSILSLSAVQTDQAGSYVAVVSDERGSARSEPATLVVEGPAVRLVLPSVGGEIAWAQATRLLAEVTGGIPQRVEFLADGAVIGTALGAPWSVTWKPRVSAVRELQSTAYFKSHRQSVTSAVVSARVSYPLERAAETIPSLYAGLRPYNKRGNRALPTKAVTDSSMRRVFRLPIPSLKGESPTANDFGEVPGARYHLVAEGGAVSGEDDARHVCWPGAAKVTFDPANPAKLFAEVPVASLAQRWQVADVRLAVYRHWGLPALTSVPASAKLIVLIHGWNPTREAHPLEQRLWRELRAALAGPAASAGWTVLPYEWAGESSSGGRLLDNEADWWKNFAADFPLSGAKAAEIAITHGLHLGARLAEVRPRRLHVIAHSAGAWVAYAALLRLTDDWTDLDVQLTLLDPFMPDATRLVHDPALGRFGITEMDGLRRALQDRCRFLWLDNYFTEGDPSDAFSGGATSPCFPGWEHDPVPPAMTIISAKADFGIGGKRVNWVSGIDASVHHYGGLDGHSGPIQWYADTIRAAHQVPTALDRLRVHLPGPDWRERVGNPAVPLEDYGWRRSLIWRELGAENPSAGK